MNKWFFNLFLLTIFLNLPALLALPGNLLIGKQTPTFLNLQKVEKETLAYTGNGYTINIPENWTVKEINENQVLIKGSKVGNAYIGFYITKLPKGDKSYLLAASKSKQQQAAYKNYTVIEESDISQPGFKAYMRRAHWFEEAINMELFVREIFTESKTHVFIISASIPNTPRIKEIDEVIVNMIDSFRFR